MTAKCFSDLQFGEHLGGIRAFTEYPNGYAASVVRFRGSYGYEAGLYEVAVIRDGDGICYDTPITDDVLGWLTEDKVTETLNAIEALPARTE